MTENKNPFRIIYEGSGAKILFNGSPLCFLIKSKNDHMKLTSKLGKFYKGLKEIGQESVFNPDLANRLKKEIDEVFTRITKAKQPKEEEIVEPDKSIDSWKKLAEVINKNMLKREEDFKFLIACVISLWFRQNDFIFVLIVGERGTGKSTMLKAFDKSDLTHSEDTFTLNAFAPGTASIGEITYSLLDECINKSLIIHDMSASLSLPNEPKLKFLGEITNSYDEDGLSKFSPGAGSRRYGGAYNFIGGITYRFLRNNWKVLSNTGRFLYYKIRDIGFREIIDSKLIPNKTELNSAVKGFLYNLEEEYKELVKNKKWNRIRIHENSEKYMKDFFEVYERYIQVQNVKEDGKWVLEYDPFFKLEKPVRRYHQAVMLLKAIAFLEGKNKVTMDDFRDIRQIFWGIDNKGERKAKLKLINEKDLPDFKGKWNKFSLFDAESKKEYEARLGLNKPDEPELETKWINEVTETHADMLEPSTPDNPEEYPEQEFDDYPQVEEKSRMEIEHERYLKRTGGDLD